MSIKYHQVFSLLLLIIKYILKIFLNRMIYKNRMNILYKY